MPGFNRLVIEKIGQNLVSVAHYFEQNGDLIAEPDVVFFTGWGRWIPIEITQSLTGYSVYGLLGSDGNDLAAFNIKKVRELAGFTEVWARNLEDQAWPDDGQKVG